MPLPVRDFFGQYYTFSTDKTAFVVDPASAMTFTDQQAARRFLDSLEATPTYWMSLIHECDLYFGIDKNIVDVLANCLLFGSLRAYPAPAFQETQGTSAPRMKTQAGVTLKVTTPFSYEVISQSQIEPIKSLDKAREFARELNPTKRDIAKLLGPSTGATNPSDPQECLAECLMSGEVVLVQPIGPRTKEESLEEACEAMAKTPLCDPAEEPAPEPEQDPCECELQKFTVMCSHGGRKQEMTADASEALSLNVVASQTASRGFEKITATAITTSPCGYHDSSSSAIQPAGESVAKSSGENIYTLASEQIYNPFKMLWLPSIKPKTYRISPNACNRFSPSAIEVNVYPKIAWNISVGYKLGNAEHSAQTAIGASSPTVNHENKGGGFFGKVEFTQDEEKKDLTLDYKTSIDSILTKLNWVQQKVDKALKKLSGSSTIKLEVFWPNISIKYNTEIKEDTTPEVVTTYDLAFVADPLIGIKGSFDAFPALLKAANANPAAKTIAAVLEAAMKGIGSEEGVASIQADIQLVFSVETKVEVKFNTSGTNGKDDNASKYEAGINMGFQLEGVVGVKGHVWIIKFEKSYKAGIKSGFVGKVIIERDDVGYYFYTRFLFNGIVVYFTKYEKLEKSVNKLNSKLAKKLKKIPSAAEKGETTEWVWIEPDADKDDPSDTVTTDGTPSAQQANRRYIIKF